MSYLVIGCWGGWGEGDGPASQPLRLASPTAHLLMMLCYVLHLSQSSWSGSYRVPFAPALDISFGPLYDMLLPISLNWVNTTDVITCRDQL